MLKACRCYSLATAEIALMWQTAPPRVAAQRKAETLKG